MKKLIVLVIIIFWIGSIKGQEVRYYKQNGKLYAYKTRTTVPKQVTTTTVTYTYQPRTINVNPYIDVNYSRRFLPLNTFFNIRPLNSTGVDFSNPWNATLAFGGGSQYFFDPPIRNNFFRRRGW